MQRVLGFDFRRGLGIFLFTTAWRTALGPTQPPIEWVPGDLSLGVKRLGHEANHSPPLSAEVKNAWSYTFAPNTSSWRDAYLSTGRTLPLPPVSFGSILSLQIYLQWLFSVRRIFFSLDYALILCV